MKKLLEDNGETIDSQNELLKLTSMIKKMDAWLSSSATSTSRW